MSIRYLTGDATMPQGDNGKVVVHICNYLGKWGKGFVLAISKRWKAPEVVYKSAFASESPPLLGDVQFVEVAPDISVANVVGQHGVRSPRNKTAPAPVRYEAIYEGLKKVADYSRSKQLSVHMPRIGCGLAGGEWSRIESIIEDTLLKAGIDVFVYDF